MGYKVNQRALEMNEDACVIYMYLICSKYRPEQLVFVDESSCDHRISREYGRAIRGQRATKKTVFVCGKRFYCMQLL